MSGRKTRRFGRDTIELEGDRLTITTPVETMPEWQVSRYRPAVVRFDGRTWRIVARTAGPPGTTRYELVRWQPAEGEVTGPEIDYSAESVALRDYALDVGRRRSRVTGLLGLRLIQPLTGFLPARVKDRLETLYGIDPVASTSSSVFLEVLVGIGSFAVATIGQMVKVYGRDSGIPVGIVVLIGMVAVVDAGMRWSRVFDEVRPPPGFLEWLFKRTSLS